MKESVTAEISAGELQTEKIRKLASEHFDDFISAGPKMNPHKTSSGSEEAEPCPTNAHQLEQTYKAAKAAYKAAKAARDLEREHLEHLLTAPSEHHDPHPIPELIDAYLHHIAHPETHHPPEPDHPTHQIEKDYHETKVVYEEAKAAWKAEQRRQKGKDPTMKKDKKEKKNKKGKEKKMKSVYGSAITPNPAAAQTAMFNGDTPHMMMVKDANGGEKRETAVVVCGGKSCKGMGSEAVAHLMGPGIEADGHCMKMCGGVGPTVCVAGSKVKVDVRRAIGDALAEVLEV